MKRLGAALGLVLALGSCSSKVSVAGSIQNLSARAEACSGRSGRYTVEVYSGKDELIGSVPTTSTAGETPCVYHFAVSLPHEAFYKFGLSGDSEKATYSSDELAAAQDRITLRVLLNSDLITEAGVEKVKTSG